MTRALVHAIACAWVVAMASAFAVEPGDAWQARYEQAVAEHARRLAAGGEPRQLLAAALIDRRDWRESGGAAAAERADWLRRARELAPDDALIAWIEAIDCPLLDCDAAGARARLQRIDPDNAATWLLLAAAADYEDRIADADAAFARALAAPRYDDHMTALGRLLHEAFADLELPAQALGDAGSPESARDVAATSLWLAITPPTLSPLVSRCKPRDLPYAELEACRTFAERLAEQDDSPQMQGLVLPWLLVWSWDQPDAAHWQQALRDHAWRHEQGLALLREVEDDGEAIHAYARILLTQGELHAIEWLLLEHGLPSAAPDAWQPDSPRYRQVLTTGRLPAPVG